MPGQPDFTLQSLFLHADPVVKGVMLLLLLASVAVWAVLIDKTIRLRRLRAEVRQLDAGVRGWSLDSRLPGRGLCGAILAAGLEAADADGTRESRADRRERLRDAMRLALADELRPMEPGLPFLATVGSTAPFVGLFGTVWGIMQSFAGIAAANDTSLAVVAPGIAEALFSTAIGLAAAIPAVIAYNKLLTSLARSRTVALGAIARLADRLSTHEMPGRAMRAAE
jgi:biopolymer transport protein ExbB/TolQ